MPGRSYYYVIDCPLDTECSECKSGKNKNFWGDTPKKVYDKIVWHLMKSSLHTVNKDDAEALATLVEPLLHTSDTEDEEEVVKKENAKKAKVEKVDHAKEHRSMQLDQL